MVFGARMAFPGVAMTMNDQNIDFGNKALFQEQVPGTVQ